MQHMGDVIRGSLARSLRLLGQEDRLAAALPVVCGSAMASHCEVGSLDERGTLHLLVDSEEWLRSMLPMREMLQHDLQRVAGVLLTGLHFVQAGSAPDRPSGPPASGRAQAVPGRQRPAHRPNATQQGRPA